MGGRAAEGAEKHGVDDRQNSRASGRRSEQDKRGECEHTEPEPEVGSGIGRVPPSFHVAKTILIVTNQSFAVLSTKLTQLAPWCNDSKVRA